MQLSVKFLMFSLYGEQIIKDIEEKIACKSEYWMMSEYDEKIKGLLETISWKLHR